MRDMIERVKPVHVDRWEERAPDWLDDVRDYIASQFGRKARTARLTGVAASGRSITTVREFIQSVDPVNIGEVL